MSDASALVRFDGVTCRYHSEVVLRGVDLSIETGAMVGVVGPRGLARRRCSGRFSARFDR